MKDVPELLDMRAAPKDNSAEKDKIVYEEVTQNFLKKTLLSDIRKFTLSLIYILFGYSTKQQLKLQMVSRKEVWFKAL